MKMSETLKEFAATLHFGLVKEIDGQAHLRSDSFSINLAPQAASEDEVKAWCRSEGFSMSNYRTYPRIVFTIKPQPQFADHYVILKADANMRAKGYADGMLLEQSFKKWYRKGDETLSRNGLNESIIAAAESAGLIERIEIKGEPS